jgi:hypothetical protein
LRVLSHDRARPGKRRIIPPARTTHLEGGQAVRDGNHPRQGRRRHIGARRVPWEIYDKDGVTKLSLSIVADRVLALRQPAKPRKLGESRATKPPARDERSRMDDTETRNFEQQRPDAYTNMFAS